MKISNNGNLTDIFLRNVVTSTSPMAAATNFRL